MTKLDIGDLEEFEAEKRRFSPLPKGVDKEKADRYDIEILGCHSDYDTYPFSSLHTFLVRSMAEAWIVCLKEGLEPRFFAYKSNSFPTESAAMIDEQFHYTLYEKCKEHLTA